ncbi:hypothetical protein [Lentilitoribacter sp. EG35]|uniref:hypothetical protein n=1 Tax=Lentilitoribacter sp. EG35 TaxID=3234192 RepID=UPI0034613F3E
MHLFMIFLFSVLASTAQADEKKLSASEIEKFIVFGEFGIEQIYYQPQRWHFDKDSSKSLGQKEEIELSCLFYDIMFNFDTKTITYAPQQNVLHSCRYDANGNTQSYKWSIIDNKSKGVIELVVKQFEKICDFSINDRQIKQSLLVITTSCKQDGIKKFQLRFTKEPLE